MLSLPRKAGYASAEAGIFAVEFILRLEVLKFYSEKVGLAPWLVGLASALAIFWDAISDPIMGFISDHTHSRWGNRRPYLLVGGVGLAAAFLLLFHPPLAATQSVKFLYLLGCYLLVNTAMTVLAVPHAALSGEIAFQRDARTRIFALRLIFGNLGLIIALFLTTVYQPETASRWLAFLILTTALLAFFSVTGIASRPIKNRGDGFAQWIKTFVLSLKAALNNGYFRPLLLSYMVAYIGIAINSTMARYYYEYYLKLDRETTGLILGVFLLVWTVGLGLWLLLSRRFGKKWPGWLGVLLLGLMTAIGYPLFPPGQLSWPLAAAVFGGLLVGAIVLLDSLVADIVDHDELKSGEHREGLFFGFWKMAVKLSRALALLLSGLLLSFIGYQEGSTTVPEEVSRNISLLFGPGVGIFFIAGALIFMFMPLTAARHQRIQELLIRRRHLRQGRP